MWQREMAFEHNFLFFLQSDYYIWCKKPFTQLLWTLDSQLYETSSRSNSFIAVVLFQMLFVFVQWGLHV